MADHNFLTDTYDSNTAILDECKAHIAEIVLPSEPASQFDEADMSIHVIVQAINSVLPEVSQLFEGQAYMYRFAQKGVCLSDNDYSTGLKGSYVDTDRLLTAIKSIAEVMVAAPAAESSFLSNKGGISIASSISSICQKAIYDIRISERINQSFDDSGYLTPEAVENLHKTFMKNETELTEDDGLYATYIILAINEQRISNPDAYKKNLSSFINSGYINPKDRPTNGDIFYNADGLQVTAMGAKDLLASIKKYNETGPHGGYAPKGLNGVSLRYIYDYSELSDTYKTLISTMGSSLTCGDELVDTISVLEYTTTYYSKVEHRIMSKGTYVSYYTVEQLQEIANNSNANIQITSTSFSTTDINGESKDFAPQGTVYYIEDTSPYKDKIGYIPSANGIYSKNEEPKIEGHDYKITYYSSDCSNVPNYNGTILTDVRCAEYRESKKTFDRAGTIAKAILGEIPFIGGICKAAMEYSEDQEVKAGTVIDPTVKTGKEVVSKIAENVSSGKHIAKTVKTNSKLISKGAGFISTGIDVVTDVYDGYKETEKKNSELDEKIKNAKELNTALGAVEAHITDYTETGTEYAGYRTTAFVYDDSDKKDANDQGVLVDINLKCRRYDENEVHEYSLK